MQHGTTAPLNAPMESSRFEEGCASSSTVVPQTQSGVGVRMPQSPISEVPESSMALSQRHNAKPKFKARNNQNNQKQVPATQARHQNAILSKQYHCAVCNVSSRDAASLRIHNKNGMPVRLASATCTAMRIAFNAHERKTSDCKQVTLRQMTGWIKAYETHPLFSHLVVAIAG
jgi:hypothetical protein